MIDIDPKNPEGVRAALKEAFDDSSERYAVRRAKMAESMAFYRSMQWAADIGQSNNWQNDPLAFDDRERADTLNVIRPQVEAVAAALYRTMPTPAVIPSNGSTRARARAANTHALLRAMIRGGEVLPRKEVVDLAYDLVIKGGGFIKTCWNPHIGRFSDAYEKKPDGSPVLDEFGENRVSRQFEGDVQGQFHSWTNVFPDPAARWTDSRWAIVRTPESEQRLLEQFPTDIYGEETKGKVGLLDSAASMTRSADVAEELSRLGERGRSDEPAEKIEWWIKPSKKMPRGLFVVISGTAILYLGPSPYRRFPVVPFYGPGILPNSILSEGLVEDLKAAQGAFNEAWSKKRELWDAYTWHILNPSGSKLGSDDWTDMAGSFLDWDPQIGKPEKIEAATPPAQLDNWMAEIRKTIDDIATQSDIARGQASADVNSAKQASLLYRLQQGSRAPLFELWEESMTEVMRCIVTTAYDYYDEGRMVRLAGPSKGVYLKTFDPADFDPDADIVIEPYSDAPQTRAERVEEAVNILTAGGFNDTPEAERFRSTVKWDSDQSEPFMEPGDLRAIEKVARLARGEPMPAQPWEDHDAILKAINNLRNSSEFEALPPEVQEIVSAAADEHEQIRAAQFELEAETQNMAAPQKPGRGGSPPKQPGPDDAGGRPPEIGQESPSVDQVVDRVTQE